MSDRWPADIEELLAVYALDAVDEEERALIDDYLRHNPRALAEVESYREALSYLHSGATAPSGLWERIATELEAARLIVRHGAASLDHGDPEATMRTMVDEPYVNHIPTLTGGYGAKDLYRFYKHHFIPKSPKDMRNIPVSRTVGASKPDIAFLTSSTRS